MSLRCPHMEYMDCPACPPVTRDHIEQSNRIEGIYDDRETERSMRTWQWLIEDASNEMSHDLIRNVQRLIVLGQDDLPELGKGFYRDVTQTNVVVGSHRGTPWQEVFVRMGKWLADFDRRTPWRNHVEFETIHPFVDGNGRTGRMLMWWQEARLGQEPTMFWARDRHRYYRDLEASRVMR